jgi:TolB-like protein
LETSEVHKQEIVKDCLEKILRDPAFASSERLTSFLRYIVTETIEGRGSRLKGYNVALSVFSRGEHFDPQTNSVVRVEATRLRKQLAVYYAGAGAADPLEIRVNRGTYVPEFVDRTALPPENAAASSEAQSGDPVPSAGSGPAIATEGYVHAVTAVPPRVNAPSRLVVAAAIMTTAASLSWIAWQYNSRTYNPQDVEPPAPSRSAIWSLPPSITIAQLERPPDSPLQRSQADALAREIASALGRFDALRVIEEKPDAAQRPVAEYRLTSAVAGSGDRLSLSFNLVHAQDNQIVWTKSFDDLPRALTADARLQVVASLASTLGRTYGVIFADRFKRMPEQTHEATGFECIMHSSRYFNAPSQAAFTASRGCVERSLKADPKSSSGYAVLAILILDGYLKGYLINEGQQPLTEALNAANEAVELSPYSARAHQALFMARFYDKRFDDAFESARQALALNPFSTEIKSRVGSAYVIRGELKAGMALLNEVASAVENKASWLEFYFFLNSYLDDDLIHARRHAVRTSSTRTPLGLIARIIVSHRAGHDETTAKWKSHLISEYPRFSADIPAALERFAMAEPIKKRLLVDLQAAGVTVKSAP